MTRIGQSARIDTDQSGMVVVPAGEFVMGSDEGPENEGPAHRVWVDAFGLGRCAVTNELYRIFVGETGHPAPPGWEEARFNHPEQPVTGVNWFDAAAYCAWLAGVTGRPYRLPTEAEWERAARGGLEGQRYSWGNEPPEAQPGYAGLWQTGPERVGRRGPNGFGLYEISENIHEWCADWYDARYYASSPGCNPSGPTAGERRASRGGSWRHQIKIARVAARSSIPPAFRYADYGFRCALSL
jgi:formylglycine-generating enzyme required for sulfatase activity